MRQFVVHCWRGWLALCLGVPGLAVAAEFRINSLRLAPDGSIEIGYPSEADSYYRLLSGETLDRVSTPLAITFGGSMRVPQTAQAGAQRFFLVQKLPSTSTVDTDTDGLPDVYELLRPTQLDPLNPADAATDPDGNGQTFLQEYLASLNDADLDGLPNELEAALGLNPLVADTDGDGLIDGLEDFDNDGLPNAGEVLLNRDPTVADSDGDGIRDGDEDSDGDFLNDGLEVRLGTDPLRSDSDVDGWPDEAEVTAGSNPLDPGSQPKLFLAAQPAVTLSLPAAAELSGLPANTIAAHPSVTLVLPAATPVEGLAPNTVTAQPSVTLVLPAAAGTEGLAPNTVVARPPLALVLPAAGGTEGLAPNTVLARPPLTLTVPALDQGPEFLPNVTLGRPPLFIRIQSP